MTFTTVTFTSAARLGEPLLSVATTFSVNTCPSVVRDVVIVLTVTAPDVASMAKVEPGLDAAWMLNAIVSGTPSTRSSSVAVT